MPTANAVDDVTLDHIVINEFEIKGPGKGNNYNKQWIELYNPTPNTLNLTEWTLVTKVFKKTINFPLNTLIKQNSHYVFDIPGLPFSEKKEQIILRDANRIEVDRTPIVDESLPNSTWQRFPNGVDTESDTDWQLRTHTKWSSNGGETISISISQTSIILGDSVTISGNVYPKHETYVQIVNVDDDSSTIVETSSSGSYSLTLTPPEIKAYSFKAVAIFDGGVTSDTVTFTVNKLSSEIVVLPPNSAAVDKYSSILGYINPIYKATPVTLTLGLPNGTIFTYNIQTNTEGFFNHTLIIQEEGTWNVSASWSGDSTYNGAQSVTRFFYAEGRGPEFSPALAFIIAPIGVVAALALGLGLRRGVNRPSLPPQTMRFFEKQAAKPKPPKPPKPVTHRPVCMRCGTPLTYLEQYGRYQCPYCRRMY
ncbi:lamin tail domain-containing protein [[Eubacterium] cellulosolvens]